MAIIRTFKKPMQAAAILEDPIPGSTYMYFQTDGVNKTSLAPQFDVEYNFSPTGNLPTAPGINVDMGFLSSQSNFGQPILSGSTSAQYNISQIFFTGVLVLNGEVTHCRHFITTAGDYRVNLDHAPFMSMDPARRPTPASHFTDGTNSVAIWTQWVNAGSITGINEYMRIVTKVNGTSADIAAGGIPTASIAPSTQINGLFPHAYPMYRNPSTGNMVYHGLYQQSVTTGIYPCSAAGFHLGQAFAVSSATGITAPASGQLANNYTCQFLGVSLVDGYMLTLSIGTTNDFNQVFQKFNDSANTYTTLNTFSTILAAGGSSNGTDRTTTQGSYKSKFASRWFTDPLTANSRGFYVPFVDSAGNYAPLYYQWNTTTDAFTRSAYCTVSYGGNSLSTYWTPDASAPATISQPHGMQSIWSNETFTVGSNRYLLFMQLNGTGALADATPKACTFVCYSVNAGDPRVLTYHSNIPVPSTPKNIVWLNDSLTILGVFCHSNFYIYTFTEASGWTRTASLPYQFSAVGRDNTGRIWAVEPGPYRWGRIHLISLTVPVTIVVTPDATTYTYTGTPITGNLAVKALDASGNRISTTVKLVIDGGSMLFGGSNYTTTVTTSASADVNAAVTISGGGVSNIIASVSV